MHPASCRWPTPAPAPTAASFSSPTCRRPGWTASTRFLAKSPRRMTRKWSTRSAKATPSIRSRSKATRRRCWPRKPTASSSGTSRSTSVEDAWSEPRGSRRQGRLRAALSSRHSMLPSDMDASHAEDPDQDDRADDRQDDACRMERRARRRPAEQTRDQAADDRADDADDHGHDEAHRHRPRKEETCEQADDEADDDVPEDVQHAYLLQRGDGIDATAGGRRIEGPRFRPRPSLAMRLDRRPSIAAVHNSA